MNRGLNPQLKKTFPNTRIVERPTILVPNIINGDWLAGFVNGDGSFSVIIREETADRGLEIRLNLNITQHIRDFDLLKSFINLLKCGNVYKYKDSCIFQVVSFTAINTIIIPGYFLISTYQLHGKKAWDFYKFSKIANLIKNKQHLTRQGLNEIKELKTTMNKYSGGTLAD